MLMRDIRWGTHYLLIGFIQVAVRAVFFLEA